jgi:site-specific DNA-methyltransferase (adenine-specific)
MALDTTALDRIADNVLRYSPKDSADKRAKAAAERARRDPLYKIHHGDSLTWMDACKPSSIHAIVTDPPYGLKEFTEDEQKKLRNGNGGVWRHAPALDGYQRSPVPRFTVLDDVELSTLQTFFAEFGKRAMRVLVPGGHLIIATNPLLSHIVYVSLIEAGLEKRGEIIRLVQTLRGGDRPKNAHEEYADVSVMPRSGWEPWGLFRKPIKGRVQDNLKKYGTGGLRRVSDDEPFTDVIKSSPTHAKEREIAPHPSLKPQSLMRQIVRAALPMGTGVVLDPFMGGGSTIAAATAVGYRSIGIEQDAAYFRVAEKAIPALAVLHVNGASSGNGENGGNGGVATESKADSHRKGGQVRRSTDR